MIGFYLDSQLRNAVTVNTPKRFLCALVGGTQTGSLYLGDPYTATVRTAAASGAATIVTNQTFEFPEAGSAIVTQGGHDTMTITYTGLTSQSLTGVTGLTAPLAVDDVIRPNIAWRSRGNIVFFGAGNDLTNGLLVSFGTPVLSSNPSWQTSFGVMGAAFIVPQAAISSGVAHALRMDVQLTIPAGDLAELTDWQIHTSNFFAYQAGDSSAIPSTAAGILPSASAYLLRQDQMLKQSARLLSANRRVSRTIPGFIVGEYRWRDETEINAGTIVPTRWDTDVNAVGFDKFIDGIGDNDDLKPLGLTEIEESVFLNIEDGTYFDGPVRYFLPGSSMLEFLSGYATQHTLQQTPAWPAPVFVGTWQRDSNGFYSIATNYRYQAGSQFDANGLQFQLNRRTRTITLSQPQAQLPVLLGVLSGSGTDYFSLPIYPVFSIQNVYVDHGPSIAHGGCTDFTYNFDEGTMVVRSAPGVTGEPVYAICDPAVAVLYETINQTRQLPPDLNPAFSGLAEGFVYLQHRRLAPISVALSCDKPLIDIPATYSSVIDMVAYGPVYFNGDYALLSATAYGPLNGETVPNVRMKVVVDPETWSGSINYQDPNTEDVVVTTGADGAVSMVFTPSPDWGMYIPPIAASSGLAGLRLTTIANDTIVLPEGIPISQVFDGTDWLSTVYLDFNNNALFGKVGADTAAGEIAWTTSGTPGHPDYKTNGLRTSWGLNPIQALDQHGNNYTSSSFDGVVVALVFAQPLPTISTIGSYFLTFLQRVTLQLQVLDSNVESNTILLQMATPPAIQDNPWLILNSATNGQLNVYRLGYQPGNTPIF